MWTRRGRVSKTSPLDASERRGSIPAGSDTTIPRLALPRPSTVRPWAVFTIDGPLKDFRENSGWTDHGKKPGVERPNRGRTKSWSAEFNGTFLREVRIAARRRWRRSTQRRPFTSVRSCGGADTERPADESSDICRFGSEPPARSPARGRPPMTKHGIAEKVGRSPRSARVGREAPCLPGAPSSSNILVDVVLRGPRPTAARGNGSKGSRNVRLVRSHRPNHTFCWISRRRRPHGLERPRQTGP